MGNLLSIHAEIFLKRNSTGQLLTPVETLTKLLEKLNGASYNGYPIIIKELGGWKNPSYRISYGDKMEPGSLFKFYKENCEFVEKIFARTFDETGDWDWIISLPSASNNYYEIRRKCRYKFDSLRIKLKENEKLVHTSDYKRFNEFLDIKINGTFNAQSDLILEENRDIVNFPIEYFNSLKTYSELDIVTEQEDLLNEIFLKSKDIKFLNEGITVHRKINVFEYRNLGYRQNSSEFMAIKYNNEMYDIFSSGWSNCIDEEYLSYVNDKKK